MDADRLRQLRSAADLPGLLAPGGGLGVVRALPPGTLPLPVSEAIEFGLPGCLPWIGVSARAALSGARHLSRALEGQGRLAGVLVLDPVGRQLAAALTLDRCRSVSVPLDAPSAADLQRLAGLRRIAQAASAPLAAALALADLLDTEEAGQRFFRAFQAVAERMADGLTPAPPRGAARTLALVQLTRVLFLYFVQARGWLDGRPDFLRRSVDDTLAARRSLHRDLFRPLFFGTLNQPPERRRRARRFGRIPFLNGGLFEPHPLERAWRGEVPTPAGATPSTRCSSGSASWWRRRKCPAPSPPTCSAGCSRASWRRRSAGAAARSTPRRRWCASCSRPRWPAGWWNGAA